MSGEYSVPCQRCPKRNAVQGKIDSTIACSVIDTDIQWEYSMKTSKNAKLPKENNINVRCTDDQKKMLESVASSEGLGVSTWLLHVGLREAKAVQRAEK